MKGRGLFTFCGKGREYVGVSVMNKLFFVVVVVVVGDKSVVECG